MGVVFWAEVLKLSRRSASWALCALAIAAAPFFVYFLQYGYYVQVQAGVVASNETPGMLLRTFLTDQVVRVILNVSTSYLTFGVILGALTAGSEYGWGTLKTVLTAGQSRVSVYNAQILALALLLVILVPAIFLTSAGASLLITTLHRMPVQWPPLMQILSGLGGVYLILAMGSALGVMLATLSRSAAVGIGLGLAYLYLVSQSLELFFNRSTIQGIVDWLPDDNAMSLSDVFGIPGSSPNSIVRGAAQGDTAHFVLVLALSTVVAIALGALAYHRRDVTV